MSLPQKLRFKAFQSVITTWPVAKNILSTFHSLSTCQHNKNNAATIPSSTWKNPYKS